MTERKTMPPITQEQVDIEWELARDVRRTALIEAVAALGLFLLVFAALFAWQYDEFLNAFDSDRAARMQREQEIERRCMPIVDVLKRLDCIDAIEERREGTTVSIG